MSFRPTTAIGREDLARDRLQELRMWPGCETVGTVHGLGERRDRFAVRVIDYELATRRLADRALRCIQREKLRRYRLRAN